MGYVVQEVMVPNVGVQYMVVSDHGELHPLVNRFLKHRWAIHNSPNTLRTYAYRLRRYLEYLDSVQLDVLDVTRPVVADFAAWLQTPPAPDGVLLLNPQPVCKASTVNNHMAAVVAFHDYLFEMGVSDLDLQAGGGVGHPERSRHKGLLYGFAPVRRGNGLSLYVKQPKPERNKLTKAEVQKLLDATCNPRDRFLVYLLYISGARIGEALALRPEDMLFDHNGHAVHFVNRQLASLDAQLKTGDRTVPVDQRCMDLMDDYLWYVEDKVSPDTDALFVTITGPRAGQRLSQANVTALFRRLRSVTGVDATPHTLRHTYGSMVYAKTHNEELVRELMGHSSIQTTMDIYVHMTDDEVADELRPILPTLALEGRNG